MKKPWRAKLADDKGLPKVCEVRAGKGIRAGAGRIGQTIRVEGHWIITKGKRTLVVDYEQKLFKRLK